MGKDVLFSEWLNEQLRRKQWTPADLIRASGLGESTIYMLINSKNKRPNPESCEKIAKAFDIPKEEVLRIANWITIVPEFPELDELKMVTGQLPPIRRMELLAISRVMLEYARKGDTVVK